MTLISRARDDGAVDDTFVCTTFQDDWQALVVLHGEIDFSVCARLRSEFDRHLDDGRCVIRVDASGVKFIDCGALGELVRADQLCQTATGALVLTRASRPLQRLLQLTRLECRLLVDSAADEHPASA